MRIALVGPGRAGTALAIALDRAGHRIVAVAARESSRAMETAVRFGADPIAIGDPIPPVGLLVVAVRDGAIDEVARALAPVSGDAAAVVHLSGATTVDALEAVAATGTPTGSFHPLQTLPSPESGADKLDGAWIAVTASAPLRATLHELAASFGGRPFDLDDEQKATYHAAAAAAANFPLAALSVSHDLFVAAGVPFQAAKPLVEAVVSNAFEHGPSQSLTGPVARGDVETVSAQLAAVTDDAPQWRDAFLEMIRATADVAGTANQFEGLS